MPLNRDALLLYAAAFLRSACAGLTGVAAAIVLKERSLSVSQTGYVIGAGLAGAAMPIPLAGAWGVRVATAHAWAFAACGMAVFATTAAYAALSPRIEAAAVPEPPQVAMLATATVLRRLVLLFGLDSLGSGFLNSALLAYWFFERYAMSEAHVALLFAAARLLNALSHLLAAWLSRRIGLLNTMVATHLPSSLLLMSAPLAPTAAGASALFLAREALVEMDVPTRQSYMMA